MKGSKVDMLENTLTRGLKKFVEGHCGHGSQNGDEQSLSFVDATVSGMKVASLVDTDLTHSFVSEQTTWGLQHKDDGDTSLFKAVNSIMKLVDGVVRSTPLEVGSW